MPNWNKPVQYELNEIECTRINETLTELHQYGISVFHIAAEELPKVDAKFRNELTFVVKGAHVPTERDAIRVDDMGRIRSIKAEKPDQPVFGKARNAADCKNLELAGANGILLDVRNAESSNTTIPVGSELVKEMVPREVTYGWMILYLTIPVYAIGLKNLPEIEELQAAARLGGVVLRANFHWGDDPVLTVRAIHALFAE